jgi:hypothetical protein
MDPSYETVVEVSGLLWTMVAYLIHGVVVFAQVSLACYLVASGAHGVLFADRDGVWLRRLGAIAAGGPSARLFAMLRVLLGGSMFAPLVAGAPMGVSLAASLGAFGLLLWTERQLPISGQPQGRLVRRGAIGFAAIAAAFMMWEREDNLALASDVLLPAVEWRNEELGWQLERDPESPKLGNLAPDFELQSPDGETQVRLSDFRGKRPVALVFGSYT